MATKFYMPDGSDLDSHFEPRKGRGSAQSLGFVLSTGEDVGDRYLSYSDGSGTKNAPTTGYKNSGGSDLNVLLAAMGDIMAVKSVQRGSVQLSAINNSRNVGIATVDANKSLVFLSFRIYAYQPRLSDCLATAQIISNTAIEFAYDGADDSLYVEWQVVEFE